jgi:hypothetical protein
MFNGTDSNLRLLVKELLLARTDGLEPRELAAFIDGWTSLLELVGRTDLALPGASPEVRERIAELVDAIREAQARVLDEGGSL